MPKKALSPKFWMNRCNRLFDAADRIKKELDQLPCNHPYWRGESKTNGEALAMLRQMQLMNRLYEQAAQISMMLNTMEQYCDEETKELLRKDREEALKEAS